MNSLKMQWPRAGGANGHFFLKNYLEAPKRELGTPNGLTSFHFALNFHGYPPFSDLSSCWRARTQILAVKPKQQRSTNVD
jgi:hypothetical protein